MLIINAKQTYMNLQKSLDSIERFNQIGFIGIFVPNPVYLNVVYATNFIHKKLENN